MPDLDLTELTKLSPDRQIDVIADAFLESWENGDRPVISEYASLADGSIRNQALRALILTEQQLHIKHRALRPLALADENTTLRGEQKTASQQSALPVQIGPYQPLYILGHGASGVVYAARELETGRMVAIKSPHAHLLAGKEDSRRFLREARYAAQLKHSGIVEFLHLGQTESGPFLVYEFLNGVDLRSYLKVNVPLTIETKLKLIADVAKALQYAHDNMLVHRDLKPSNLMVVFPADGADSRLSASIEVKILDFGIARLLDAATLLTNDGEMLGTPAYMSPEQASGQSQKADHRADIYSLGVILYELLTGTTPFRGTSSELVNLICRREVPLLISTHPSILAPVSTICQRCLRLNPADRYAQISQVAVDIERFLRGEPILAKPVSIMERARSKWKQLELAQIATTALVAILVTGLVVAFVLARPPALSPIQKWLAALPGSIRNVSVLSNALPIASVEDLSQLLDLPQQRQKEILESLDVQLKVDGLAKNETESILGLQCLLDPGRAKKPENAKAIVNWICTLFNEDDTVQWDSLMRKLPLGLSAVFEPNYLNESEPPRRIQLAKILSSLHRDDPMKYISFLDEAKPGEILVWSKALEQQNQKPLPVSWSSFEAQSDFREVSEEFCVLQANRIFARYAMGDTDCLFKALEDRDDPRLRTYCVHRFKESGLAIQPLTTQILSDNTKPDVLYALLMILAMTESSIVNPGTLEKLENWVVRQYEEHPDSGVHGMCRFLVAKWQLQGQVEVAEHRLMLAGIVKDKQWFINSLGMHMSLIKGKVRFWMGPPRVEKPSNEFGAEGRETAIEGAYAIGMDEVTVGQFNKSDHSFGPGVSPQSSASGLSWIQCYDFCNWLNQEHNFPLVEASFDRAQYSYDVILEPLKSVKQYRLPTSEEWEYASRGKTVTARFQGSLDTPFSDGVLSEGSPEQVLPNRWGLKNNHASQAEWTMSPYILTPSQDSSVKNVRIFLRDKAEELMPKSRSNSLVATALAKIDKDNNGMRIVLRLPDLD